MKQKRIFQNGRLKKTEFFNHHQKLSNFHQNFTDWSLGQYDWLMWRAAMWLNLYGRQAVQPEKRFNVPIRLGGCKWDTLQCTAMPNRVEQGTSREILWWKQSYPLTGKIQEWQFKNNLVFITRLPCCSLF